MSTLLDAGTDTDGGAGRPPAGGASAPVLAGLAHAAWAAAASLVVVLVPVVLAWAVSPGDRAGWAGATRVGADTWLLAHRTGIAIPGGHLGLAPLGLLAIPLLCCWFAGARLARSLDPNADALRAGVGRARPSAPPLVSLAALVGGYATLTTVTAAVVGTDAARPLAGQALLGGALVAAAGAVPGAAAWRAGGVLAGLRLLVRVLVDAARLPVLVRAWLLPAATALAVHLGAALVLVLALLVAGWDRVLVLHAALDPGWAGGAVLVLAQLLALPNAVLWAAAALAGPGFAVGTGTSVTLGGTELGALPALPMLGALPIPGGPPGWVWYLLAVPVLAGAAAGWRLVRSEPDGSARLWLTDAVGSGALAGVAIGVLGWLSGGPGGPGRLAQLGPSPWQLALATGAEVAAGAVLAVGCALAARLVPRR